MDKDEKQKLDSSNEDSIDNKIDNEDSTDIDIESIKEEDEKDLKIKELEDKYIRAYADFENVKKRLERDKYQSLEYANEEILRDFIPILDTLESAMNSIDNSLDSKDTIKNIKDGIQLTIDNFIKALKKNGVELISTDGEFDPNIHNAIMQVEDAAKKNGDISKVIQKGYKYKDRVLRPSMVSITKNN